MAMGIIKSISEEIGIGYFKRDGGAIGSGERYFHRSSVDNGLFADLREEQRISYSEERDPRVPSRFHAVSVRRIER